jgi:preprotein translocase subunit SecG
MADTQKSMVSIVAIIAIVILVGIVVWFIQRESDDGLTIEIGGTTEAPAWVATAPPAPADIPALRR